MPDRAPLLALACAVALAAAPSAHARSAFQYAVFGPGHTSTCSFDGDQSMRTFTKLQDEVQRTGGQVLWFAIDGREYVVRDTATVARAQEIVEPMSRLGEEQGRLGSQQGELGRRQGELGRLEGEVAQVEAHLSILESRDDPRHRAELDEMRQQLGDLRAQVRLLAVRQRELGAQQAELGRRQSVLGAQQRRASLLAFDQLQRLATRSVATGTAKAVDSN